MLRCVVRSADTFQTLSITFGLSTEDTKNKNINQKNRHLYNNNKNWHRWRWRLSVDRSIDDNETRRHRRKTRRYLWVVNDEETQLWGRQAGRQAGGGSWHKCKIPHKINLNEHSGRKYGHIYIDICERQEKNSLIHPSLHAIQTFIQPIKSVVNQSNWKICQLSSRWV